ncbi:hypothetical protein MOQ_001049 [Trypanosoma cruzi marinkellei]|uniref:WW domain-containing protein n=1 Tax=Trypanosoma cruzi marinkellei TaxID=85056 RepID=K2NLU7_TRYCR|nr:hypothetical protein MOQ_001049 [Trypanosoma cruzi marinkellei]
MKQEETGRTYYYHTKTKQTCWDLKKELMKQRRAQEKGIAEDMAAEERTQEKMEKREAEPSVSLRGAAEASVDPAASVTNQPMDVVVVPATPLTDDAGNNNNNDVKSDKGDNNHSTVFSFSDKGRELMQIETYKDPLERLMDETNLLEKLMLSSGTSQAMALDFQRSYEALARTNKALTTQMVKMKQEYGAMEMALKEANMKLYEKDLALRELQCRTRAVDKKDEAERTLTFLREQNQELVRQVGELTVALSRGFNELAYQRALTSGAGEVNPEKMAANPQSLNQKDSLGTTLDRVLSNAVTKNIICSVCMGELEKLRLSLLSAEEKTVVSSSRVTCPSTAGAGVGQNHHAHYVPAVPHAVASNYPDHPTAKMKGGMDSGDTGGSNGYFQRQPPPSPSSSPHQQQRQGQFGTQGSWGVRQSSYSAPQNELPQYSYSRNGVGLHSYPYAQQLTSPERAYGQTTWNAQADDGDNDTYAEHFPRVSMNRRSESRNSVVSATPVFGGFRIRPSH